MTDIPFLTPLPVDTLRAHGVPAPFQFGIADQVRFSELDALNHVNHTTYLRWFESLRVSYLRAYGVSDYSEDSPTLVLKSIYADYKAPMFLNETYIVAGRTKSFRNNSFVMEYGVFAPNLRVLADAVIVLLDKTGQGRHPLSDAAKDMFATYDQAKQG